MQCDFGGIFARVHGVFESGLWGDSKSIFLGVDDFFDLLENVESFFVDFLCFC